MAVASAPGRRPTELLVVQSTSFCNIDCSYCYLPDRSVHRRMALGTVEALAARIVAAGWTAKNCTVVWHAGEPLVVGPEWYAQAFELFERHRPPGVRLSHAFQTNGTLINPRWVDLFRRHGARVGVSLDGPRELHDLRRRTRDGRGTFERTMAGVRHLQDAGIPFHVISVLGAESLRRADELFDFYLSHGIDDVCFNIEEIEGTHLESTLLGAGAEGAFRAFFARFIERVAHASRPMRVREISSALAAIMAPEQGEVPNHQAEPLAIITVDVEGNLSTFSPELIGARAAEFGDFRFANIHEAGPEAVLAAPAFMRARDAIAAGLDACRRECAWFRWCGGGAPANKFYENGSLSSTQTLYCRLNKQAMLDVVLEAIETDRLTGETRVT